MSIITPSKWLNSSIWPVEWTLIGATIPGQSECKSNDNEGVFHIAPRLEPHPQMHLNVLPSWWMGREVVAWLVMSTIVYSFLLKSD